MTLETVESIQEFSKPHPFSTEAAVASLKRYLPNPEYRIRVADLIKTIVDQVIDTTSGDSLEGRGLEAPIPSKELVSARMRRCESACSTLLAMAPYGGLWAEEHHYYGWGQALTRLGTTTSRGGSTTWIALDTYPARLLLYALGMGAVQSGRLQFLNQLFKTPVTDRFKADNSVSILTSLFNLDRIAHVGWERLLEGKERSSVPLSDWVHDVLRQPLTPLFPNDEQYDFIFDKLEILISLGFALFGDKPLGYWVPPGAFIYRSGNREAIIEEFVESVSKDGVDSPLVRCGIFGDNPETCLKSLTDATKCFADFARGWRTFL